MKSSLWQLAAMLPLFALIFGSLQFSVYMENQEISQNIQLIDLPVEVLSGEVQNMVTTSVYSLEDDTEIQSLVVNLCSGKTWTVPSNQIDLVEKWLKSGLAPYQGCN